jgi:histidine phosphotransfer protein HptB
MIDWERVADLRAEVGEDDFNEVVELFLEEVEEVIDRLETSPVAAKFEEDLHFLKGSALNLGFRHFSSLCQIGEKQAANGRGDLVDIPAVLASYRESRVVFLQEFKAQTRAA